MSTGLLGVLLNWWNCRLLLPVYCWTDCRSKDTLLVFEGRGHSFGTLIQWRRELHQRWDAVLTCCRDAVLICWRGATFTCCWDATLKFIKTRLCAWDAKVTLKASLEGF